MCFQHPGLSLLARDSRSQTHFLLKLFYSKQKQNKEHLLHNYNALPPLLQTKQKQNKATKKLPYHYIFCIPKQNKQTKKTFYIKPNQTKQNSSSTTVILSYQTKTNKQMLLQTKTKLNKKLLHNFNYFIPNNNKMLVHHYNNFKQNKTIFHRKTCYNKHSICQTKQCSII